MRVIGYLRVSTEEQGMSGAGLEAQQEAIRKEADRRGWEIIRFAEDVGSGKDLKRPGIQLALDELARGDAGGLVVAKLDRLSRSLLDFAGLMEVAQRQNWALVALDVNVDTSTPAGEAMASVVATFAQFERRLIGQRTREALAIKKAQGVRLGRRPEVSEEAEKMIAALRAEGATFREIVDSLTQQGVPTARGGHWSTSTVAAIYARSSS